MHKQEAKAQLEALQAEMDKLKAIIEAPEKPNCLIDMGEIGTTRWYISADIDGGAGLAADSTGRSFQPNSADFNCFATMEQASDYAKAFNTFLQLRTMPGSEEPVDERNQYQITPYMDIGNIMIEMWLSKDSKTSMLSPCFATSKDAQHAIDTIGKNKLLHMFKTFHGLN